MTFYPIYMHEVHPLNGAWVKLSAKLVEGLVAPPGWESSHPAIQIPGAAPSSAVQPFTLFHHINHPLPYVQLCGLVVDITERYAFTELKLDDSSGVLATALFKKRVDPEKVAERKDITGSRAAEEENPLITPIPVKKEVRYSGWLSETLLDIRDVQIGSVLRIKGRPGFYKFGTYTGIQILIEKYNVFRSTFQEIQFWKCMSLDFTNVLSKPWMLTHQQMAELTTDFERVRHIREKQMTRMRRHARRELRRKESAADGERKGKKQLANKTRQGQLLREITSAALAPSYQVPQKGSSSETKSSITSECIPAIEESSTATLSLRLNMELDEHKAKGRKSTELVLEQGKPDQSDGFTTSLLLNSTVGSTLVPPTKSATTRNSSMGPGLRLVDAGSPSQWRLLDLSEDDKSTRTIYAGDWLVLSNSLSVQNLSSKNDSPSTAREKVSTYSVVDEWNNLEL